MGYYTSYYCANTDDEIEIIKAKIEELSLDNEDFCYGLFSDDVEKWYEANADLEKLSLALPTMTIYVEGNGEEQGDMWKQVWRDGKCVHEYWIEPDFEQMVEKLP